MKQTLNYALAISLPLIFNLLEGPVDMKGVRSVWQAGPANACVQFIPKCSHDQFQPGFGLIPSHKNTDAKIIAPTELGRLGCTK